jgi:hypothetical protein
MKFGLKFVLQLQFFKIPLNYAAELSAGWELSAGIDCCWRRAPVTGVNEGETGLS